MTQSYDDIKLNGYKGCGSKYAIPIFMVFQVVSIWMILNMTVAAVIDGMQTAQDDNDRFFKSSDIDEFIDLW